MVFGGDELLEVTPGAARDQPQLGRIGLREREIAAIIQRGADVAGEYRAP